MQAYSLIKIYKETYHGFKKYKTETQPNRPIAVWSSLSYNNVVAFHFQMNQDYIVRF